MASLLLLCSLSYGALFLPAADGEGDLEHRSTSHALRPRTADRAQSEQHQARPSTTPVAAAAVADVPRGLPEAPPLGAAGMSGAAEPRGDVTDGGVWDERYAAYYSFPHMADEALPTP